MTHSAYNAAWTISVEPCQQLPNTQTQCLQGWGWNRCSASLFPDSVLPPRCSSKVTSPPREEFIGIGFSQTGMTGTYWVASHPRCLRDCCHPPWLGPRLPLQHPSAPGGREIVLSLCDRVCNLRRNTVPTFTFLMGMGHKWSTVEDGKH